MEILEEKTLSATPIFDGKVVKVRTEQVQLQDGNVVTREVIAHTGGVGVINVDENNDVLMVTQYRTAAKTVMLEIPAGKLELGEDPLECGKRELIEETGYKGNKFTCLGRFFVTPAYCEEKITIYLAQELEWVGQNLDDGEFLNVKKYSLDELYEMVMNNEIVDAKTIIAILKAKEILRK